MAIDDIIRQIEEDAKAEADSLLSNAKAEADAIREKSKRQAEKLRAEETQKAEEKAKEHGRRIETLAGLELRKEILKEKKNLIEDAFAKAEAKIAGLSPDEHRAFLEPIILKAVESGNEEVVTSAQHRDAFTPEFIQDLKTKFGSKNGGLRLSEESGDFSGGFVLREGKKEINLTLTSLVTSIRDSLEPEVAKILFGENK
jgi:V/A-type H+-transporting ATPase subunit E